MALHGMSQPAMIPGSRSLKSKDRHTDIRDKQETITIKSNSSIWHDYSMQKSKLSTFIDMGAKCKATSTIKVSFRS